MNRLTLRNLGAAALLSLSLGSAAIGIAVAPTTVAMAAELGDKASFRGADRAHPASGNAEIVRLKGGGFGIKLASNFRSRGGPDLRVWVSEASNPRNARAVRAVPHTDLGRLKSSSGEQIYRLPASVKPSEVKSVVIWCRAFGVFFGSATFA